MSQKTALYNNHLQHGGKMVDFAGWELPLHYGSQLQEHLAVRKTAGMFDVSHMLVTDISGPDASAFLQYLLANNISKLDPGKALYSCLLNSKGGVIDDLIVYQLDMQTYRIVSNAGTREKVSRWLAEQKQNFDVSIQAQHSVAIIAIQGPDAIAKMQSVLSPSLASSISQLLPFHFLCDRDWLFARTGYTGEDGLEIILPATEAPALWEKLLAVGVHPCGLGARDTLRLEAGLNLYGADMDETTTPLEANLEWTVAWEPDSRQFIGKEALLQQRQQGPARQLVGLITAERTVLRAHQPVILEDGRRGEITSGSFSPTLQYSIAFARIPRGKISQAQVLIRDKQRPVTIVKPPFFKRAASQ